MEKSIVAVSSSCFFSHLSFYPLLSCRLQSSCKLGSRPPPPSAKQAISPPPWPPVRAAASGGSPTLGSSPSSRPLFLAMKFPFFAPSSFLGGGLQCASPSAVAVAHTPSHGRRGAPGGRKTAGEGGQQRRRTGYGRGKAARGGREGRKKRDRRKTRKWSLLPPSCLVAPTAKVFSPSPPLSSSGLRHTTNIPSPHFWLPPSLLLSAWVQ